MTKIPILFELMEERFITANKLSSDTGIALQCITDWENGRKVPTMYDLITLANYFQVTVDYLVGRTKKYTMLDDDYILSEWVFRIDETKLSVFNTITNPILKKAIKRQGVYLFADDLGEEGSSKIYSVSIGINDIEPDKFALGCISTSQLNAKSEIIDWVYTDDTLTPIFNDMIKREERIHPYPKVKDNE